MAHRLDQIPADAQNIQDVTSSWKSDVYFGERPLTAEAAEREANWKLYTYDTHVGLCIHEREYNGRDDSDFYMIVWNEEKQEPESIQFASTRGWSYPCYGSHPDATPEVLAKYKAYQDRIDSEHLAYERKIEATRPSKGRAIEVIKTVNGRKPETKIEKGMVGVVFYESVVRHFDRFEGRVGFKLPTGEGRFTDAKNVRVVES